MANNPRVDLDQNAAYFELPGAVEITEENLSELVKTTPFAAVYNGSVLKGLRHGDVKVGVGDFVWSSPFGVLLVEKSYLQSWMRDTVLLNTIKPEVPNEGLLR